MDTCEPTTITDLLVRSALDSSSALYFVDDNGDVTSSLTYGELIESARLVAKALLSSGLASGGKDIVVTNFSDQRTHILMFWGCCFAGIPVCPTPPFHPDETRQSLLLRHLQEIFHKPTFVSDAETLQVVQQLVPEYKALNTDTLLNCSSSLDPALDDRIFPSRIISPDETVALMLTSGSTGNSKGVVLPHSVIVSTVNGKMLKNGTRKGDKFLNWINFDHVANMTEAHLQAICAGASQYHVSASAVIRKPRNLLDWCSKYHITHTFSPNFLLAQICRDTTITSSGTTSDKSLDLSSLRVFISGGEANPVKTAVEFSNLIEQFGAPRTTFRAAFGMTETGAGSIYNTCPILSLSDYQDVAYLSLGTPCVGLMMRTVDPATSQPCAPGVPGQLQVTGTSVFRQYYANPSVTEESFTADGWFMTGDLAFIDDDGFLHMLGRHKDDINVNGVKHPSKDVEHFIDDSDIAGVENSFVYVSAVRLEGADTETYAVFYKHANVDVEKITGEGLTDDEAKEILVTNRGIKNICSIFCSQTPHVIYPLPSHYFVKTALGKVSRSALAKAYEHGKFKFIERFLVDAAAAAAQGNESASAAPRSAIDEVICEGVALVFDLDPTTLELDQNLFDIGATSMHLIRLKQFMQDRLHIQDIPIIEMLTHPVISDLSAYVQGMRDRGVRDDSSYNPLVCLNHHGTKPPIYLVHPGVGEVLVFTNLARVLDDDRPIYALRARGFEGGETPPTSIKEMADIYTASMVENDSTGPYFIAGYSFGGAVAVEIAKVLERMGKTVAWVGILNLPPFIQFRLKELVWVETMLNLCMFLALISSDDFETFKARLLAAHPEGSSDVEPPNSKQIIAWAFAHSNQERLAELRMAIDDFHRWIHVAYHISATGRTYEPSGAAYGALTTVFCAIPLSSMGTTEQYKRNHLSKWKDYSGPHFEMVDVDGEHYTMLSEDHVESFARYMKAAIHQAEQLQSDAHSVSSV